MLNKVLCVLMILLLSCPLFGVGLLEGSDGESLYVYTEEEHKNVQACFTELNQWRMMWPLFTADYEFAIDGSDIWKASYEKETRINYDLKVQRNVLFGFGTITTLVFLVYFFLDGGDK